MPQHVTNDECCVECGHPVQWNSLEQHPKYGKWIKVNDELPIRDEYVLILMKTKEYFIGEYKGAYGWRFDDFTCNDREVLCWMPLPEPPEVEPDDV